MPWMRVALGLSPSAPPKSVRVVNVCAGDAIAVAEKNISKAQVLFQLISTEHTIDQRMEELQRLHEQASDLRAPLVKILKSTFEEAKKLQQDAASEQVAAGGQNGARGQGAASTNQSIDTRKKFDQLTDA